MRTSSKAKILAIFSVLVALASAAGADAAGTPEQQCQKGRYDASGKYAQCQQKVMGQYFAGGDPEKLQPGLSKCRVKYTSTWAKLQKKAEGTGSTCDASRFDAHVNGTVTDNLTGLQWEFNAASVHNWQDANDTYVRSRNDPAAVGGCLAGFCDWRLPTRAELQTLLSQPFPCSTSPCIDGAFGATAASFYWTDTLDALDGNLAWVVHFGTGLVGNASLTDIWVMRAVRGGL